MWMSHVARNGEVRLLAGQWLTDDAREETGGGCVRRTRAYRDGWQTDADTIEEAPS